MPRQLTGMKLSVKFQSTLTNVLTDASSPAVNHPSLSYGPTFLNGIDALQANRSWQSIGRTLAGAASETLDLSDLAAVDIGAGVGLDGVGQDIVFEEIVAIVIVNDNDVDAAGLLEVDPSGANGWTGIGDHTVALASAIGGQGMLMKVQPSANGLDVNPAGNRNVDFTANGGPVTYSIYIWARHDDEESSSSSSSTSSISTSSLSSSTSSTSSSSQSSSSQSSSTSSPSSSSWSSTSSSISTSSLSTSSSSISTSSVSSSSWSSQS